jgi:hypothetical protein
MSANANYLLKTNDEELLSKTNNLKYSDITLLIVIGLIQTGDFVSYQLLQRTTVKEYSHQVTLLFCKSQGKYPNNSDAC